IVYMFIVLLYSFSSEYEVYAEIPSVLDDKIYRGSGAIDLTKNVTGDQLSSYISSNGGKIYFGVDLSEDASGNEMPSSIGVALKKFTLTLTTTNGVFTFNDFYTNTTANIIEKGTASAQTFHTLFGTTGSNDLKGSLSNFDISSYDDVISLNNINFTGTIINAKLDVNFVNTDGRTSNEAFFDFSGGFENFSILTGSDASIIESADVGLADAPTEVTYQSSEIPAAPSTKTSTATSESSPAKAPAYAPSAPSPAWFIMLPAAVIIFSYLRRKKKNNDQ
ncbi:MAG: hypothetical protein HQK78_13665, partial [Desulfobacterales bacterium]|nr:hypothetical protein [Desulfobacterales bacterium]